MFILFLSMTFVTAQTPIGFNYQAVARDTDGNALANSNIEIVFTIKIGSEFGTIIWEELHNLSTGDLGAFSVVIGGSPELRTGGTIANFSEIDWSSDSHFLQVTLDANDMGTTQLMSVPYAALAQEVVNGASGVWASTDDNIFFDQGNVSIGSSTANSRLTVQGDPNADIDTALFGVKNINGDLVFAVYNEGVRIYIEDTEVKGTKGGFAVGGYNSLSKGIDDKPFLIISPDSARIMVNESVTKGIKGGFAVGGYNSTKATPSSFMQLDPENYFIGHEAGINNIDGRANVFIGNGSGEKNTGGFGNVYLGNRSGNENINGSNNTIVGHESGHFKSTGSNNTLLGGYAGFNNTTGWSNVFLGHNSDDGRDNTYVGADAGFNATGDGNIFIGSAAGFNETGSNKLYIENSSADSSWALIYGDFDKDLLTINGRLGINTTNPWNDLHVSSYGTYAKLMAGQRDSIVGYAELAGSRSGPAGGSLRLAHRTITPFLKLLLPEISSLRELSMQTTYSMMNMNWKLLKVMQNSCGKTNIYSLFLKPYKMSQEWM